MHVSFSADCDRPVDVSVNIQGDIPNRIFTTMLSTITATLSRADIAVESRQVLWFACKKFYQARQLYDSDSSVHEYTYHDGNFNVTRTTAITLHHGRLHAEGNNTYGQCGMIGGVPDNDEQANVHDRQADYDDDYDIPVEIFIKSPRLIRLPPVLQLWHCEGSWYALTSRGLYSWGANEWCQLGTGKSQPHIFSPTRVELHDANDRIITSTRIYDIIAIENLCIIRSNHGWFGCGRNTQGQLGLGHSEPTVPSPKPILNSDSVTHWTHKWGQTIGWTPSGPLACGGNWDGQCGVGDEAESVTILTPVALPQSIAGRVNSVTIAVHASVFYQSGRSCFVCGRPDLTGIDAPPRTKLATPIELPFPVDDLVTDRSTTLFRSGDTVLACGKNKYGRLNPASPGLTQPTPLPLPLPCLVTRLVISGQWVYAKRVDGTWIGQQPRGWVAADNHLDMDTLEGMDLPEPIDNGGLGVMRRVRSTGQRGRGRGR